MNYEQAAEKLDRLRELMEMVRDNRHQYDHRQELAILYGELEPIITQLVPNDTIKVKMDAMGSSVETFSNYIEAGYLSSRTTYQHAGHQQLLKVIGRVRALASNDSSPPIPPTVNTLVAALQRFRECCQYLGEPPKSEKDVQDVVWIMLRAQFDRLQREESLPKFGVKAYRPDFGLPDLSVLIEVKYIAAKANASRIQEELIADIPGYLSSTTQYAGLVMLVYDAGHALLDPAPFRTALKSIEGVLDVIVVPGIGETTG